MNETGEIGKQDYKQAQAFVATLTGDVNTVMDFRAINETDRTVPGIPRRGTLAEHWEELCHWNNQGYGIYCVIAETDGLGKRLENVTRLRAHYIDLDGIDAVQQLEAAKAFNPAPSFAVQSSPGKYHVYWLIEPHNDRDRFTLVQRKLVTRFNSDPSIIDIARILRLPGTLHMKNPASPTLVSCFQLAGFGTRASTGVLEVALWGVEPAHGGALDAPRTPIGLGERAPSTADAVGMLQRIDVATVTDRNQWVAITGAFMQSVAPEDLNHAYQVFQHWNLPYPGNDPAANVKVWNDILQNGTTVKGWSRLHKEATGLTPQQARLMPGVESVISLPANAPGFGPILNPQECAQWFDGCVLISSEGKIRTPKGLYSGPEKFNSEYGGKMFIWDAQGKITDEPWKAATRSQLWTVPKVEFTCFRPSQAEGQITQDELGRRFLNVYKPAVINCREGDASPWLNHLAKMFPDANDRRILIEYLAHNVKYPGHKVPWAPLIQGAEGIGKNAIKKLMRHAIGKMYFYEPKAKQLNNSGSKFNGWMENKLFFMVDEIKTDENRDLVEVLKPFITEIEMEIEGKGSNQRMGDTPGNWLFFSNHKDAIPITKNGRRYCILYSPLQTVEDIAAAGMGQRYFDDLYSWLGDEANGGHFTGIEIVTHYLMNYPVERGGLPNRAPVTSSTAEAIEESRGWLEQIIAEAVETGRTGFRGGWVSTKGVAEICREQGRAVPSTKTLNKALSEQGYHKIGRVKIGADRDSYAYSVNRNNPIFNYEVAQRII
ncbi:DUF5906 domain-containing protein [Seohaeicola zhoushanensis]|uniref:RepB-like DNA primase domain-containing protein n=1 Tax=Seohaeicola zhoushanensis TaxID=1569283 RepID=A0A8J3GYH6_9RHOB|nr:DUF5906 domain-containing protein [Seohaeicola zhoushanensis]GHF54461.1 hypothetical protein GCM10017056_27410 [Seohaeicola zhoushanensis]